MKGLLTKFCAFSQKTTLFCKNIGFVQFKELKVFHLLGKKTFYSIFALESSRSLCLFKSRIGWNQNQQKECLFVIGNSFCSFFKSIKFLFLLFFFSFFSVAWTPSERNCSSSGIRQGLKKVCSEGSDNAGASCTKDGDCKKTILSEGAAPKTVDTSCVSDPNQKADRQTDCDRWREDQRREREDQQREEESAIEAAERRLEEQNEQLREAQDRAEEQRREQKALVDASKQECKSQYEQFRGERNSIEDQVRNIESQIDEKRQDIINQNIEASREEEEIKQSIQKLKANHRKLLNSWETKISKQSDDFDMKFEAIKVQLSEAQNKLEQAEIAKQTACTDRFNAYDLANQNCYDQAMAEVAQTRQTYYTRLYQGNQEFSSASEVFSTDFENVEQRFIGLLNEKKRLCYQNAIGNTEIVACNLETVQARDKACQTAKQDSRCPTPQAVAIENKLRNVLAGVALEQKTSKEAMERIYKQIGELPTKKQEALKQLQQELKNDKQNFEEEFARLSRRLEERQLRRFQDIRKLTEEIQRLEEEDPARHFKEELDFALHTCCFQGPTQPGDPYICRKIGEYASQAATRQFLFISSTPRSSPPPGGGGGSR